MKGDAMSKKTQFTRRDVLKYSGAAGAATLVSGKASGQSCVDTIPVDIETASNTGCPVDADFFPTSPLILNPFVDPLPIPKALRPGWRNPDGTLSTSQTWAVRQKNGVFTASTSAPGPGPGEQDSMGERAFANDGSKFTFQNPKNGVSITKT